MVLREALSLAHTPLLQFSYNAGSVLTAQIHTHTHTHTHIHTHTTVQMSIVYRDGYR